MRALFLILLLTIPSFSQTLSEMFQEKVKTFESTPGQKVTYDKFHDVTLISADSQKLKANGPYRALFDAHFSLWSYLWGKEPIVNANTFSLYFYSDSSTWLFMKHHGLILLVDGQKGDFGEGSWDGNVGMHGVSETIKFHLTRSDILAISKAQNVEFQLGGFEGEFSDADRQLFKNVIEMATIWPDKPKRPAPRKRKRA